MPSSLAVMSVVSVDIEEDDGAPERPLFVKVSIVRPAAPCVMPTSAARRIAFIRIACVSSWYIGSAARQRSGYFQPVFPSLGASACPAVSHFVESLSKVYV
jgi:hypothetical protein